MILIGNVKNKRHITHKCPIYVGRPSALGNIYTLNHYTREEAINNYALWLEREYEYNPDVQFMIDWIKSAEDNLEEIMLLCHCYPERCHAEVIKRFVGKL